MGSSNWKSLLSSAVARCAAGDYTAALTAFEQAALQARQSSHRPSFVAALLGGAYAAIALGRPDAAQRQAHALQGLPPHEQSMAWAAWALAFNAVSRPADALAAARRSYELLGNQAAEVVSGLRAGLEDVDVSAVLRTSWSLSEAGLMLGQYLLDAEQAAEARKVLVRARNAMQGRMMSLVQNRVLMLQLAMTLAKASEADEPELAWQSYQLAMSLGDVARGRTALRLLIDMADFLWSRQRADECRPLLERALAVYREHGLDVPEALASIHLRLARLAVDRGARDEAAQQLRHAELLLSRIPAERRSGLGEGLMELRKRLQTHRPAPAGNLAARLAAGGEISLEAGTVRLEERVVVSAPLTLVGAGRDATVLRLGAGATLVLQADAKVQGIGFERPEGDEPLVEVTGGQVELRECGFIGPVGAPSGEQVGLKVSGKARVLAQGCFARGHARAAFEWSDDSAGELRQATVESSGRAAVWSSGRAQLRVSESKLEARGASIFIGDDSRAEVTGNVCTGGLEGSGIAVMQQAAAKVVKNSCVGRANGIEVQSNHAQVVVEENECRENQTAGIALYERSVAKVLRNRAHRNGRFGIQVGEQSRAVLEGNECNENEAGGICLAEESRATAVDNRCIKNNGCGISTLHAAAPTLERNRCERNVGAGLGFFDESAPVVRGNQSEMNQEDGILVAEAAAPRLEQNVCKRNRRDGIKVMAPSGPKVIGNECLANNGRGLSVEKGASATLEGNRCEGNREGQEVDDRASVLGRLFKR
jgi:parallel beta-helix repeat protein